MLSKEEFKQKLTEVLENAGDPGKVSTLLTGLHESYGEVLEEHETLTQTAAKLKEANESLVKSNGELFRYVGLVKEEPEEEKKDEKTQTMPGIDEVMENLVDKWGK